MKEKCCVWLLLAWVLSAVSATTVLAEETVAKPVLAVSDCGKCHELQPLEIAAKGAAHKTQINCLDCHQGHRPAVANNIPKCGMCHSGEEHFQLEGCTTCHNPHQPLDVVLKGNLKAPCLTCHAGVGEELSTHPSKHNDLACNFCHAEKHGAIPACSQCHEPHSTQMTQADCRSCHQPHQPLTLEYGPQTASVLCASCHADVSTTLAASKAKHRDVACVTCHQSKHKTIPQCADCHGMPHPETMHQMFPKCASCHHTAHDLNNWPEKKEGKKLEEKAGAKKNVSPAKEPPKKDARKGK